MHAVHFDTLAVATKFKQAGFTEAQAETLVLIHRQAIDSALEQAQHDYHLDEIATKRDLKELEAATKRDLKELEAATKRDLKEQETALKHDLKELEIALKHDIELLRAETKCAIAETQKLVAETKADLTRWIIGAGLLQSSLIIGALMKIAHLI